MATKLGRVGMYKEELPSMNSIKLLITWSCKVTWNIRFVISLLQKGLWSPNLARWWRLSRSFRPESYTTLWTRAHVLHKLKTYLHYRNVSGYQTWLGCYIQRRASIHKVSRPFCQVVFQGHVKNYICYISTTTMTMATKPGRMVPYNEKLPSIKSQNLFVTRSCKVT